VTSGGTTPQSFGYDLVIGEIIDPLTLDDAKVGTSTGAVQATRFFLKIDGVGGTSTYLGHKNWFDIDDFSLGVARDPGDAKFLPHQDFGALSVTGEFDAALAALLSNTASGKGASISVVEIEGVDTSTGTVVYDLTLNDVVVSALSGGGTDGSNTPENIVFSYGSFGLVTSGATTQSFGYDPGGPNSQPQIIDSVIVTQAATVESHSLFASDADGDPLTFAQSTPLPAGSATVSANGFYSYVAPAAAGVDAFTYTVSDGQGNVVTGRVDVTIVNGLSALDVTGTAGRDVLRGTNFADIFNGAGGDDLLYGGEGGDSLVGGTGNDSLYGESGADTLLGGQGNNLLAGGAGSDLYIIDNAGDLIVENTNEGVDAVRSLVTYTLAANVETLVLLGGGNLNGVGSSDNNILAGNSGNNMLDGAAGADIIAGGPGNDTYVVDNSGDQVMELGNSGIDQVLSGVSYDLMQAWHVENLTLTGGGAINGSGNWLDNVIAGNAAANMLNGNKGNDTLDGGAGNDTLRGGSGDDVLVYDAADGSIDGGTGTDTLRIDGSGLSIDLGGLGGGVIRDIEVIDITGSGSNILTLNLADVLALSSTTNILHIIGNAGDVVDAEGTWIAESYSGSGPRTYTQGLATLLIEPEVGLNVP
jgi:Ca2+-binding RTX toxin-like protein